MLQDIGVYEEEDTSDEDDSSLDSTSDTDDILDMVSEVNEGNIKLALNSRHKPGGGKTLIQTVEDNGHNDGSVAQELDTNQQHESLKQSNTSSDTNKENGSVT